ncbi:hypothetical protein C8R46DRAFT_1125624 [Mycena filopes]|nr:hypothetical protein C8R46DRAFT_1125624 [Mycena filopes]
MLAHLAADRARVAELGAQILQLQDRIHELDLEKGVAQERLDRYCYPVLALPNEITSEIFTQFLPPFPSCPPLTGPASPTLLTHICRAWRLIALNTPTLWRAISLTADHTPFTLAMEIADVWFTRSRSCPLSIEIHYAYVEVVTLPPRILQEAARLEDLRITAPALHPFLACLPANSYSMPLLRRLELQIWDADELLAPPTCPALFCDAPQLRSVVLDDLTAEYIQLPWAQLTSVSISNVLPRDSLSLLGRTCNLLHCELWLPHDDDALTELSLPSLESLLIHDTGAAVEYLDSLTLPALQKLSIPEPFLGKHPIDALNRFIHKSTCKLQELCITGEIENSTIAIYRTGFPLIPRLTLDGRRAKESSESDNPYAAATEQIYEIDDLGSSIPEFDESENH